MEGLFAGQAFQGFGPSQFLPPGYPPALQQVQHRRPSGLRPQLRELCPRRPGVYGMLDPDGKLVYLGKAKSLRGRLLSYFRPRSRDAKAGRIVRHVRTIVWEPAPDEFGALLRELELIRRWRPRFNVQGQPHRYRRTYVCLGRRPAPYAFLAATPPPRVLACYGPVPAGPWVRECVRRLNDAFGLRDCPHQQDMVFADQRALFPLPLAAGCIRHEIGTCLGPCAAACSRSAYEARVRAARAFLDGRDGSILKHLEDEMKSAAAALIFERAAVLRNNAEVLRRLSAHLSRLRHSRDEQSFVYTNPESWYLVHQGRVLAAVAPPSCSRTAREADRAIHQVFRRRLPAGGAFGTGEIDAVLLVAAWFRKYPGEKERTVPPEEARSLCRSGQPGAGV